MKAILDSLDGLDDLLKKEYTEKEGKFVLTIEGEPQGFVPKTTVAELNGKLEEFRTNNRGLMAEKTELTTKLAGLEGIDPDEHKTMKEKIAQFEKKGVKKVDDLSEQIQAAVTAAVNPLNAKLDEITTREKETKEKLTRRELENSLTKAGLKAGVEEKAMPDYLRRGMEVFTLEDDKPVAKNGTTPIYSTVNTDQPMSPEEWAVGLSKEAPHLFKESKGGGSGDGGPGGPPRGATITADQIGDNLEKLAKGEVTVVD